MADSSEIQFSVDAFQLLYRFCLVEGWTRLHKGGIPIIAVCKKYVIVTSCKWWWKAAYLVRMDFTLHVVECYVEVLFAEVTDEPCGLLDWEYSSGTCLAVARRVGG